MALLKQIYINSIDVSSYAINCTDDGTNGEFIKSLTIKFNRNIHSALTLTAGQTVEYWRGTSTATDVKEFSGYIEKLEPETGTVTVICKDKLWDAVRKEVNTVYLSTGSQAGKLSAIFLDLITTYAGLNADATTVQDSGTVFIIEKFICNRTDVFERCKKLADTLGWQFYYKASTDKVYFEPKGMNANSTILTVGSNVIGIPKWNDDVTEMINDLTVRGAVQEVETTEIGRIGTTSGYTTTEVTLAQKPESVKVYADAVNPPTTLRAGGVPSSTGTYYYYVDKENQKILPAVSTTFTTNDYFEIRYSYYIPAPVNVYDQSSIDTYGRFSKTIELKDVRSVADAEARGLNFLSERATPYRYAELKVKSATSLGINIGDSIQVIDNMSRPVVNETLVVNRKTTNWPGNYDTIIVGDRDWKLAEWQASVEERLKRIFEETDNTEIVTQIINADNTSEPIQVTPRYRQVLTTTATAPDVFILGHSSYGRLGTDKLGDAGMSSEVQVIMMQYNNTLVEEFIDNDFKGSGTAYWDTTNGRLCMSSGSMHLPALSEQEIGVFFQDPTLQIQTINLTATEVKWNPTDSIRYYISTNNRSSWVEITPGTTLTLTPGLTAWLKVVFLGNGNIDTYVDDLTAVYTVA